MSSIAQEQIAAIAEVAIAKFNELQREEKTKRLVNCTLCKGHFEKKLGNLLKLLSVFCRRQLFQVPLPSIMVVIDHITFHFSFYFF